MYSSRNKILLVEDEVLLAMNEKMQLQQYGYTVKTVNTGEKAVEAVQTLSDIDLILMDINLGKGIDGTRAAEIILEERDIPIVFLSSHTDPEVVEKTEKITSYGYVVKNSSVTVLDASMKMAFKLFEAKQERKRVEEQLRFQAMVLDQIADQVIVTDLEGRITYINEAVVQTLGYNQDELVGASIEKFGDDPEKGVTQFDVLHETLRNGEWRGEIVNWAVDGRKMSLESRTQLIRDNEHNPIALCGVLTDITDRERMERELQESEAKFRALFEKGPIGVAYHEILYDAAGNAVDYRFLDANSSYRELTGVDPRGRLATEAFPGLENDPSDWIGTFGRVAATGEEIRFEQYLQPNDRWYDCVAYQVKPDHFVAAFVEITARKRAEQAMLEQRNFAEKLIETARTMILVLDTGGNIVRFNPYTAEMIGYTLEEVKGENWIERFVPPLASTAVDAVLQKTVENDETTVHANPIVAKDGRTLSIEWYNTTLKDTRGQAIGVLATGIDQTVRENVEEEIHLHEEILKHVGQAVIATDSDGKVIYLNPMAESIYGWSAEEARNKHMMDLAPTTEETREALTDIMGQIANGKTWSGEFWVQREGNYSFPVQVTNAPIFDTQGDFIGAVGISEDITQRKKSETALQKQLTEKETLLREVHHRVKNNVAHIEGLLSLQAGSSDNSDVNAALYDALSRVQSMRVLYDRLLLSKDLRQVSIKPYAESLVDSIIQIFDSEKRTTVQIQIADFEVEAQKAVSIGIILNELLTNTYKYAIGNRTEGFVSVSIEKAENDVTMTVRDDGGGVDETVSGGESTGLGLTIVTMLVEQLSGVYRVEEDDGRKTIVELKL